MIQLHARRNDKGLVRRNALFTGKRRPNHFEASTGSDDERNHISIGSEAAWALRPVRRVMVYSSNARTDNFPLTTGHFVANGVSIGWLALLVPQECALRQQLEPATRGRGQLCAGSSLLEPFQTSFNRHRAPASRTFRRRARTCCGSRAMLTRATTSRATEMRASAKQYISNLLLSARTNRSHLPGADTWVLSTLVSARESDMGGRRHEP